MNILALIAAFSGGIIDACVDALPVSIITGIYVLVGRVLTAAGVGGDVTVNHLAFGSLIGPHIAFAGGVAAAGYAGRRGKLVSGTDILSPLNGLGEPDVLLMSDIFGVLGFLIHYCIGLLPVTDSVGLATTDLSGITIFILAVVTRLAFGKAGLAGKYIDSGKRKWFATGKGFVYNVVPGDGTGIVVSFIAAFLYKNEFAAMFSIFPIVCLDSAVITLIFTQTGFATPATHHIFLPSGLAVVTGITAWDPADTLLGVLFGALGSLLGDLMGKNLSSHCDTHIDPPTTTVSTLTIAVNVVNSVTNA